MRTKKLRKIRRARKRKNTYKRKYLKKGRGKNRRKQGNRTSKTAKLVKNNPRPYCLDILKECTRCFKNFPAKDQARTDNNSLHPSQYTQSAPGFLEAARIRAARINAEQISDKTPTPTQKNRDWVKEKAFHDRRYEKI